MYLKCDADTVENLRGWIKREFEIQAGQTGREIVGFTLCPLFILPCFIFENSSTFFLQEHTFFRGCMKCSENSSKKIAKRKKGGGGDILSSTSNLHRFRRYQFVHLFPPKTLMFFFFRRWFPLLQSPISVFIKRRMFHLSREKI